MKYSRFIRLAATALFSAGTLAAPSLVNATDGRASFLAAQALYTRQTTFKAHGRVTGNGSREVSYEVEARLPNAYHITMQHGVEGIVHGSDVFMKAGNSWMRAPMAAPQVVVFPDRLQVADVRMISADHFSFTPMSGGNCELWLSHTTHLPQTLQCRTGGSQSHVDYYDWNAPVGFTVPQ